MFGFVVDKNILAHWGPVTHIYVSNPIIIGSDSCLAPAIIWPNAVILSIGGQLGTNLSEILIEIPTFLFTKMRLKVLSEKWRPFCHGINIAYQASNPSCKLPSKSSPNSSIMDITSAVPIKFTCWLTARSINLQTVRLQWEFCTYGLIWLRCI